MDGVGVRMSETFYSDPAIYPKLSAFCARCLKA